MEFDKVLENRHSVRDYEDKPISDDDLGKILLAAESAPLAGNIQNCKLILVKDPRIIKEIAFASLKQNWMEKSKADIILCSDDKDLEKLYQDKSDFYSVQNSSLVAENLMLKAADLGIGTCFIAGFNESQIKRALRIPKEIKIHSIITLGYGKSEPSLKTPVENFLYFEEWGNNEKTFQPLLEKTLELKEDSKNISKVLGEGFKKFLIKLKKLFKKKEQNS